MANGFDIGKALKLVKEGREPITVKEADKFTGRNVMAAHEIYGKDVLVYEGTLEKVGSTFHPRVIKYLNLRPGVSRKYTKKLFGWKQIPHVMDNGRKVTEKMEDIVCDIQNFEVLFCEGEYYPVHVGEVLRHFEVGDGRCKYCEIANVNEWVKNYMEKAWGFGIHQMNSDNKGAIKNALKKYPGEFKEHFGEETFNELAKALLKK